MCLVLFKKHVGVGFLKEVLNEGFFFLSFWGAFQVSNR